MDNFFLQCLQIQQVFGVDTSFDFITGRDFYRLNDVLQQENTNKRINMDNIEECKINKNLKTDNNNTVASNINENAECYKIDLSNVKTFDDLTSAINNFNGCALKRYAKNTVIFDGNCSSKIMLIGEAPGEKEDETGKPFCGQSGQLLRKALSFINLTTDNVLITNTIYWRPPENRKPTEEELRMCLPFLLKMIEIVNPKIILLCGATAIESIMRMKTKMSEIVGKLNESNIDISGNKSIRVKTFALYHPSYLLRQPSMKKVFWKHLLILQDQLIKDGLLTI